MVALLNKWWIVPALSLSFYFTPEKGTGIVAGNAINLHPIHLSTVEIEYNTADKNLEITCKIFWDDFESILTRYNNKLRVDLVNEKNAVANNKLVSDYINNHLALSIDGKPVTLSFVGFEKEDVVIYSYLEVGNIASVKKITVTNNIMHDMFDDQIGIIHVIVNGNRKSTKLEFPMKQAEFVF